MEEKSFKINATNNANNNEKEKQQRKRIKISLLKVSLMAMLLIVSTYAWFTSQKDITLSNIRGVVEVVENMEISLDAKTWYQRIDLSDAANVFATAQSSRDAALGETDSDSKTTALAMVPNQLLPVSGIGELDNTTMPLYKGEATSTSLSAIAKCIEETVDPDGKDIAADSGYFAFDIYIKNTSRDNEADVLQLNVNSSAQVLTETIQKTIKDEYGNEVERTYNGNDASGLQNTIRVALAKYEGEITSTATQLEILNSTKAENIKDIAIWEPNAYDHVETIVANNNRLINGTEENKITFTEYHPDNPLDTYALKASAVTAGEIENVYNIADTGLGKQNTLKTDNIKNADDEVESYRIYTADEKPIDIQNILGTNFEISANTVTRYRVYVWLEGQDVDCINVASLGGGIELELGLTKDNETGDVLANADNRVSYSEIDETTNKVTATITMKEEIAELPEGWEYVDATTKVQIKKEYTVNTIEQVEIKNSEGKITKIEVIIDKFDTVQELANVVTGNKNEMYGSYTNYPIDIDGVADDNDWQIFYVNGNDVFIIPDDYILTSKLTNGEMKVDTNAYSDYRTYGTYFDSDFTRYSVNSSIANKYIFSYPSYSSYYNWIYTAFLLDTDVWTNFVNADYAESAVGAPTVEMWIKSWNEKFSGDNNFGQLSWIWDESANAKGYDVRPHRSGTNAGNAVGYQNEKARMYFPHPDQLEDINGKTSGTCPGYWLAGPNFLYGSYMAVAHYEGMIGSGPYDYHYGLRPLVCLQPEIKASLVDDVWMLVPSE